MWYSSLSKKASKTRQVLQNSLFGVFPRCIITRYHQSFILLTYLQSSKCIYNIDINK